MILALVAGFSENGLYESNANLASVFRCSRKTIINNINCLRKKGYVIDAGPDNYHRKLVASGVTITLLNGGGGEAGFTTDSESSFTIPDQKGETSFTQKRNNKENNKQSGVVADVSCSAALFDRFWSAYPKQINEKQARKKWKKINPDTDLFKKIMSGLSAWKATEQWTKDNGRFIPHPSNWLRDRRWEDQVSEPDGPASLTRAASYDEARKLLEGI